MPTLLWTDALFLTVLASFAIAGWRMRAREHLRRPWRKVVRSPGAMMSAVILSVYVLIGVLDSIRFHPQAEGAAAFNTEPLSLLDSWLTPLRTQTEKTYSAPLAIRAYAKERYRSTDGREVWDFPPLEYAGQHLDTPDDVGADIARRVLAGMATGGFGWTLTMAAWTFWQARQAKQRWRQAWAHWVSGRSEIPWRTIWLTLLALSLMVGTIGSLAEGYHVLGTDKVGEDVLYQSLKSIRTGLVIGTLTTFATLPLALLLGIVAGYYRGWLDDLIQYVYTTLNSIPDVLLIAAAMLVMQAYMNRHEDAFASLALRADLRLLFLCLILGLTNWTGLCRLLRAETLKLREMEYVQAAKVLGVAEATLLMRHILPNVFHLILISVALDFSSLVLAEAVLSYINIGVDPTTNSWGNMINGARLELARDPSVWWSLAAAFVFMFALVLPANIFADAVRDAFDPRRAGPD